MLLGLAQECLRLVVEKVVLLVVGIASRLGYARHVAFEAAVLMIVRVQAQVPHAEVVDADLQVVFPAGKAGVDGVGRNETIGVPLHDGVEFFVPYQEVLIEDVLQARDDRLLDSERVHLAQTVFRLGVR